jgi:hypothetical protein
MRHDRWIPGAVLAAALTFGAGGVAAQPVRYWNQGQRIAVEPKMHVIPNTDVYYQRRAPGYDLYRYADRWYLVDDGDWFQSDGWRGPYVMVADLETLPEPVTSIPEDYGKYWKRGSKTTWASARTFREKPEMRDVTRSGVSRAYLVLDVDLYRYRSEWYLVENGQWYHSDSWKGPFLAILADRVPLAVRNVPKAYRRHWGTGSEG